MDQVKCGEIIRNFSQPNEQMHFIPSITQIRNDKLLSLLDFFPPFH